MDGPLMRENRDSSGTTAVDLWQQLVNGGSGQLI